MTAGLPLMKNVITPLAKSVLIPLGLTATASATDAAIQKKIFRSGATVSMISNEELEDIRKIGKSLEESGLLIKLISKAIKNEAKELKSRLVSMLLGALAASLLGNALTGVIRAGEVPIRAGQSFSYHLIL